MRDFIDTVIIVVVIWLTFVVTFLGSVVALALWVWFTGWIGFIIGSLFSGAILLFGAMIIDKVWNKATF